MRNRYSGIIFAALITAAHCYFFGYCSQAWASEDALADNFQNPPSAARPHTWWHWINGNITKEGIKADLESMQRVGIGGVTIVNVLGAPHGSIQVGGPAWYDMVDYAVTEANRLGLEIGIENCAGWTSSGGPWIQPEFSMQEVVTSVQRIQGPLHFDADLPLPPSRCNFYRDIAVLAFPTPDEELISMKDSPPLLLSDVEGLKLDTLLDPKEGSFILMPRPEKGQIHYIQLNFKAPFLACSLEVHSGPNNDSYSGKIQISTDGKIWQNVSDFSVGGHTKAEVFSFPPVKASFYRLAITQVENHWDGARIASLTLSPGFRLDGFMGKAAYVRKDPPFTPFKEVPSSAIIHRDKIINLTGKMNAQGRLVWDIPSGNWTILRVGHTSTGAVNNPPPTEASGLECDKLSRKAAKIHWDGMTAKVLESLGNNRNRMKHLDHVLIDSYEVKSQNWTEGLEAEFQKRCGYDITPYLPILTGRAVESVDISDRFLWDFRRTIADLFAENYYDQFAIMAHEAGLKLETETYGNGPFDEFRCQRDADISMGEFWAGHYTEGNSLKLASSSTHIYGKKIAGAEAFTSAPPEGRWLDSPALLKRWGDGAFVEGINQFTFHTFAHQPWLNRAPGMTMMEFGTQLERTNTWWEQGAAWIKYLTRCQYLLQQGPYIADIAYFVGEDSPTGCPSPTPTMPAGYHYDLCDMDAVMHLMSVKEGRICLPSRASYKMLLLPPGEEMTPALLQKIQSLVLAGGVVMGPKPLRAPGLVGYPQASATIEKLAAALWDTGKILPVAPLDKTLTSLGVPPDFQCIADPKVMTAIHRIAGDADVYFVINRTTAVQSSDCRFRVTGKIPALWYPDTGMVEKLDTFVDTAGLITLPLRLGPAGSAFVIFRQPDHSVNPITSVVFDAAKSVEPDKNTLTIIEARYGALNGSSMDVTAKLSSMISHGTLKASASNALFGRDPAIGAVKKLSIKYIANGEEGALLVGESEPFQIPQLSSKDTFPAYKITDRIQGSGLMQLEAWQAGNYVFHFSDGKTTTLDVASIPPVQEVTGDWEVTFPPGLGAPEKVQMDRLMSWSDSTDSGVKYFSGTASYHKTLEIAPALTQTGRHLYLDLGDVQVIAEVWLNGKDLGVLWKPPFCVDITGAVKTGFNDLRIQVTNLWPNRLIGDEQLPDDGMGASRSWKKWPQWLLDGKPSPTGRITFTSFRFWRASDPLLPSGLLGPVLLRSSAVINLPPH